MWLKKIEKEREEQRKRDQEFLAAVALREKRFAAAQIIRRVFIGFSHRNEPYGEINKVFLRRVYENYLKKLSKEKLPTSFMAHDSWPNIQSKSLDAVTVICHIFTINYINFFIYFIYVYQFTKVSIQLKHMHKLQLARKYRMGLTPERKQIVIYLHQSNLKSYFDFNFMCLFFVAER